MPRVLARPTRFSCARPAATILGALRLLSRRRLFISETERSKLQQHQSGECSRCHERIPETTEVDQISTAKMKAIWSCVA